MSSDRAEAVVQPASNRISQDAAMARIGPGLVVLVVGPSGAGKDALIDGAREALDGHSNYIFPTRIVARPPHPAEVHKPISPDEFFAEEQRGAYALHWQAHGTSYAIPCTIDEDVRAGRTVVINTSRRIVQPAVERYDNARVVMIDAPVEVRAQRLAARGRETATEIEARLTRSSGDFEAASADITIENTGTVEQGVDQLLRAIGHLQ